MPKLLIISAAENADNIATNDAFVAKLNATANGDYTASWTNYHGVGLRMSAGNIEAFTVADNTPLSAYDAVYFKSYFRHHEQAAAIAEALQEHKISYVGSELQYYIPAYKLTQMARLARGGVTIPQTLYLSIEHYEPWFEAIREELGVPFIFKAIDGSTGDDNYLVQDKTQLHEIVAQNPKLHFIAQRFVPNESDLRLLVVGGRVRLVIERRRADDSTHLNNTSQGASAALIPIAELDPLLDQLALHAAQLMDRDIAGVDVMVEKGTGLPYVLEVNASPQIASGAFEEEKLALYNDYFRNLVRHD